MKLKKEELLEELKQYTGERTDDETLKLIEDVSDSLDGDGDGKADAAEWQQKYEDLAKKYKDRFSEKIEEVKEEKTEPDTDDKAEEIKTEDLFKEEEK